MATYETTAHGNQYMQCDGFGISYNANPGATLGISFFASDAGSDETALIVGDEYFILNGDFRSEYAERAGKGVDECLRFFMSKSDDVSTWSASVHKAKALIAEVA